MAAHTEKKYKELTPKTPNFRKIQIPITTLLSEYILDTEITKGKITGIYFKFNPTKKYVLNDFKVSDIVNTGIVKNLYFCTEIGDIKAPEMSMDKVVYTSFVTGFILELTLQNWFIVELGNIPIVLKGVIPVENFNMPFYLDTGYKITAELVDYCRKNTGNRAVIYSEKHNYAYNTDSLSIYAYTTNVASKANASDVSALKTDVSTLQNSLGDYALKTDVSSNYYNVNSINAAITNSKFEYDGNSLGMRMQQPAIPGKLSLSYFKELPKATSSKPGIISAADKSKLDSLYVPDTLTQAQYDALTTKENKLYFIKES